jgi:hypothetical protein
MAGWSAFLGGAAKSVKRNMDEELAMQRDLELTEAKNRMLMDLQRRNEKIAQGIDPNTGEAFTIYGDGSTQSAKLPQGYLDQMRAAQEAEASERRLQQDKLNAEIEYKQSGTQRNRSLDSIARDRLELDRGKAASQRQVDTERANYYSARAKAPPKDTSSKDPNAGLQKDVDALYKSFTGKDLEGTTKEAAARKIKFSQKLTPQQKLEALMELFDAED